MNTRRDGFLSQMLGDVNQSILSYMDVGLRSKQLGEQARQMAWKRRMDEKRFNIENVLAIQDYRSKARSRQWQRDFMYALGGLGG